MKLIKIRLENFRQFYGQQILEFSTEPERNVTLVHSENGIGKTTLLNSLLWCFYSQTTQRFEEENELLNFTAADEGKTTATVEVTFEHEEKQYRARRSCTSNDRRRENFQVFEIFDGNSRLMPGPINFIASVIPKEMAPHFFFDGEHAETFSSSTNYKKVGDAIRNILGFNLAKNALSDLKHLERVFSRKIGSLPGQGQLKQMETEIEELEDERTRIENRQEDLEKKRDALQDQVDSLVDSLRKADSVKHIQKQRDGKDNQLKAVHAAIKEAEADIVKWVGTQALAVVSDKLISSTLDFIDEESLRGRIPSPYNEEFVRGLLQEELCVCGRSIEAGGEEWKKVATLLDDASNAELLGRVVSAKSRATILSQSRATAPHALTKYQDRQSQLLDEGRRLEQELAELSKQIEDAPVEQIVMKEVSRKHKLKKLQLVGNQLGEQQSGIKRLEGQIRSRKNDLREIASKTKAARVLLAKQSLVQRAHDLLTQLLAEYEEDARAEITTLINVILGETARRDYTFQFTDGFRMGLFFPDGRVVPRSGGENQLMSLSFIASLVKFSMRRANSDHDRILTPGTIAPLMLDSPFGQLDPTYRSSTAQFVPKMAPQVVLLLSSSQASDNVMSALGSHIGKQYVLISENRGPQGTKPLDVIELNGRSVTTSLYNCERTLTRIEEAPRT